MCNPSALVPKKSDFTLKGALDPRKHVKRSLEPFQKPASPVDTSEQDAIDAENAAAEGANLQVAASRRRRRLSSLFAGGRSVLGAASGRGAPAGAGAAGGRAGGGTPITSSALAGGARSFGGRGLLL